LWGQSPGHYSYFSDEAADYFSQAFGIKFLQLGVPHERQRISLDHMAKLTKLVVGMLLFGALLAIRAEAVEIWERAALAACAGCVLGWVILQARRR
jgi:hypothetical protein